MLTVGMYQSWDDSHAGTAYPLADDASLLADDGASMLPIGVIVDAVVGVRSITDPVYIGVVRVGASSIDVVFAQAGADLATVTIDAATTGWAALTSLSGLLYAGKIKINPSNTAALFGLGIGAHRFDAKATALVPYVVFFSPSAGVRGISLPDGRVVSGDVTLCIGSGLDVEQLSSGAIAIHAVGLPYRGRDGVTALKRAIRRVQVDVSSGDGTAASATLHPVRGAIAAFTDAAQATKSPAVVINGAASTVTVEVSS